jgi:ABC-2 type transport system permease protein
MIAPPPGTLRVLWILAGSALRRLLRAQQMVAAIRTERKAGAARQATARKARGAGIALLFLLFVPLMGLNSMMQTAGGVTHLAQGLEAAAATPDAGTPPSQGSRAGRRQNLELMTPHRRDDAPELRAAIAAGGTLLLSLLLLILCTVSVGSANWELGRAAWSFPWLLTFPVPARAIVLAKIGEYTLVQLLPWFTVFPLCWQLLRAVGWNGPAPLLAIAATLGFAALTGSLRFLLETWLRLRFSLQTVRSVQGTCALLGIAGFGLLFSLVMTGSTPAWFLALSERTATIASWLPMGWPLAIGRGDLVGAGLGLTGLLLLVALVTVACTRLLGSGYERSGGVDSGRRVARRQPQAAGPRPLGRIGMLKKDLLLLARDRNFLAQTIGVPIFVLGMQLFLPRGDVDTGPVMQRMAPTLVYFASVAALSTGCFMVLSSEGRALWLLYAQPVALAAQLRRKVYLWAAVAMTLAIGAFTLLTGSWFAAAPWRWLLDLFCVAVGVFGAAWLAAGIGSLGTDPAADQVPRAPKPRYVYLFMYLAGSYVIGLASENLATRAASMLVFGTLAWSLWQRTSDRLPWLLDPHGRRQVALSAYDAGAAVTTFLLLQTLLALMLRGTSSPLLVQSIAFAIAGGGTMAVFGLLLMSRSLPLREHLGFTPRSASSALVWTMVGIVAGTALGWLGLQWLEFAHANGWIEPERRQPRGMDRVVLLLLTVGLAPVFEELLFRGLLFQALRRSVSMALAAVWSALLFTVLHPVAGWPMVFLLGLCCALLVARSRFLPACMAMHAVYNLIVVGFG